MCILTVYSTPVRGVSLHSSWLLWWLRNVPVFRLITSVVWKKAWSDTAREHNLCPLLQLCLYLIWTVLVVVKRFGGMKRFWWIKALLTIDHYINLYLSSSSSSSSSLLDGYCLIKLSVCEYTVFRKKQPLLFSCITLRKSNQFEWQFQT